MAVSQSRFLNTKAFASILLFSCNKDGLQFIMDMTSSQEAEPSNAPEAGLIFQPKFDRAGLLTALVVDAADSTVLMVGFVDAEALEATRRTGLVHFHSRSRGTLWQKGEASGHVLRVVDVLVDCDQDALLIRAVPAGPTCHTGARSCFYRRLVGDALVTVTS